MSDSHPLLIQEPPLLVLPTLAVTLGLNQAIIMQQLQYWLSKSTNIHEGKRWVYNTYDEWAEQLPFWSARTIQRLFLGLESDGLIISGVFNRDGHDRTKWYTIDYDKLSGSGSGFVAMALPDVDPLLLTETTTKTTTKSLPPSGAPPIITPGIDETIKALSKEPGRSLKVDESFRERMRSKYENILTDIDDRIDECLAHPTTQKHKNKQLTVQGWLRRDAERTRAGVIARLAPSSSSTPPTLERLDLSRYPPSGLSKTQEKMLAFKEQVERERAGKG